MNKMTVADYLKNVNRYVYSGKKSKKDVLRLGDNWTGKMQRTITRHYKKLYIKQGMSQTQAETEAKRKAKDQIQGLAVLHQPDKYAGGAPAQTDVDQLFAFMSQLDDQQPDYDNIAQQLKEVKLKWFGTSFVNSNIGITWKDNIGALDEQAKAIPKDEQATTLLNVKLELIKDE